VANDPEAGMYEKEDWSSITRGQATVGKDQGPLAALRGAGLSQQQAQAMYGQMLRNGQITLNADGVPQVQSGQVLDYNLSDMSGAALAGRAIGQESSNRDAAAIALLKMKSLQEYTQADRDVDPNYQLVTASNERMAANADRRPTIENARRLGIYSGDSSSAPDLEHDRGYVATRSGLNMVGSLAGMVTSGTGFAVGVGLVLAPEPTLVSKPAGYAVIAYTGITFTKNAGDFSLNAANLWKATTGSGNYYQDSVPEQFVSVMGGSEEQIRLAAAGNAAFDLVSGAPGKVVVSTGAKFVPGTAALLQSPLRASVDAQSAMKFGNAYRYADKVESFKPLRTGALGFDVNENILNPFGYGYMPSEPKPPK
jgi:hypothetical protein